MRGLQDNEKDKARNRERRAKRSGQENLNRTPPYMYKGSKLSDWTTEGAGCKMGAFQEFAGEGCKSQLSVALYLLLIETKTEEKISVRMENKRKELNMGIWSWERMGGIRRLGRSVMR